MIVKVGSFSLEANEATLVVQKSQQRARGYRLGTRERWEIEGIRHGDTLAALKTNLAALEAGLADGGDLVLLENDGSTETYHKITNSATIGGIRLEGLSFPQGAGGEYSTYRTYRFAFEAVLDDGETTLVDYQESLRFVGTGGPRVVWLEALTGLPQGQVTAQATTQTVFQRGRAVGYKDYPFSTLFGPGPIFPAFELFDRREIEPGSPENIRGTFVNFPMTWSYTFQSPVALVGQPGFL